MPEFKAGRAYIEVAPSLKGFRRKTEADLQAELSTAGEAAGERLGRNIADGAEKGAAAGGRRSAEKFAGEFDKQVRTRITAALKSLPEAQIGAATTEAEQKIRDLREKLVALSDKRIGIDIDATEALSQIEAVRREMSSIDGDTLKIDARLNAAAAIAELEKLKIKADLVDGDDINIDVNVDTAAAHANLSALQAHAAETAVSISSIGLAIGLLGPALIPLAAGGVAGLAGLGGAAVGAAGGLGVLAGALAPVVGAVTALNGADAEAGRNAATAAKAREAAAQRTESAAARVSDAARSVKDAEEQSSRRVSDAQERLATVHEQVAQRVSDAQERLASVREQVASRAESASRTVEDAEARLAAAQRESLVAQQAINDARNEARRTLEDLALALDSAQLQERGARLSVAEAQDALKKSLADPKSTHLQRDRAQLALEQAQQSLEEIRLRTKRLKDDKATADKKGVEGSDAVTKAQDRAKTAAGNVADAERALADARAAQVKAQRDGAAEIAKATRDVARAQRDGSRQIAIASRDVARAQKDGAKQVAAANLQLTRAQDAYRDSLTKTGTQGSAAMDKVDQAMAKLTPTGQKFAKWIFSLKDSLVGLSKIAQDGFLPGLMDGMQSLGGYAGLLKDAIKNISTVLGDLARDAGKALAGPFWQDFFKFLAMKTPGWLDTLGRTLGAAATGMAALFKAFAPIIDMMGQGSLDLMERFAAWAKGLGQDQGFQRFLAYIKESGPKVAAFIGAFAGAVTNLVIALAPFSTGVLDVLTSALNWIAQQDPNKIGALFTTVLALAGAMKAFAIAQALVNAVMALSPWGLAAVAIGALVGVLIYLYQTNADVKAKIDEIWKAIQDKITGAVAFIQQFWKEHGAAISAEWDRIWTSIESTFNVAWQAIQDIARSIGGWLQTFWKEWGDRIKGYFSAAWEGIKYIIDGALQFIRGLFETFAGLFTGDWGRMWNGLKDVFNGAAKVLWGIIKIGFETLKGIVALALAAISSVWGKTWEAMGRGFSAFWDGLLGSISGPIDRVMQFIQENLIDKINGLFAALGLDFKISPIWTPDTVGSGMVNAGRTGTSRKLGDRGYREGGYTGNKGVNDVAGVVHGREFVMDASTTAKGGGPAAMESIRRAIQAGWKPAGYKAGGYVNPVGRRPSFPWGSYPSGGRHPAFDYAVPIGTRVVSPYSGVVLRDGWDTTGYGTSIRGRSDDGIFFVLGHLMRELVSAGQHIAAGQLVGFSGNTGHSSGPHLHFGTSHSPNMIGPGAFNPDTGGGTPGGSGGNFITDTLASLLTAGVGGITSFVSSGLSGLGFFGKLMGGVVSTVGTGVVNLGLRLLGLDGGGAYPGASDGPREAKPLLFDSGGYLPTGISIVKNATGKPEPLMRMNDPQAIGRGPAIDYDAMAAALVATLRTAGRFEVAMSRNTAGEVVYVGSAHNERMGRL